MIAIYRPPALPDPLLQFLLGVIAGMATLLPTLILELGR